MKSPTEKLLKKHQNLVQTDNVKVCSHVQREQGEWIINTLMIDNIDVPFKYKRKTHYRSLTGQQVNLTYYPSLENVAGFEIEVMKIVRIRTA